MISFDQQGSSLYGSLDNTILALKSDLGSDFTSYSFNLDVEGYSVSVTLQCIENITLTACQVTMVRRFQSSLLSLVINQEFTKLEEVIGQPLSFEKELSSSSSCLSSKEVTYLLLPCKDGRINWSVISSPTISFNDISIQTPEMCHLSSCNGACSLVQTKGGPFLTCILKESVVYTVHTGLLYSVDGILDSLNANSSFELRNGESLTYKTYYKLKHDIDLACESSPFLAGRHISKAQNYLVRRIGKTKGETNSRVELPPELCTVIMSPLPIGTLNSFKIIPTIMHRVQCMALASVLKNTQWDHCIQNVNIPSTKILEAITAKKCHENYSYESLEALGDSFLKYAASQHLFAKYEHHHEGILSKKKERLVSNATLCCISCLQNLAGYVRMEEFNPKQWTIPGLKLQLYTPTSTKDVYTRGTRMIKSKKIADVIEALIGACLSEAGDIATFNFLERLGLGIKFQERMAVERPNLGRPEMIVNRKELEELLSYKFNDPWLLVEALTHGSYQMPDVPRSYQRLEFLGDAVLDHCITMHLYKTYYEEITPGLLTDLRSASVNNDCYAHAAVKAGLNKHILHASSELHRQITVYLQRFGSSFLGSSYGWDAGIALPKVLGDVIESLAGAIYLDSGCNKDTVWRCIRPLLEPLVSPETVEYHPVRELEELCSRKHYTKSYRKDVHNGVGYVIAEVQAGGITYTKRETGPNKKTAKMLAAKAVLKCIKESEVA